MRPPLVAPARRLRTVDELRGFPAHPPHEVLDRRMLPQGFGIRELTRQLTLAEDTMQHPMAHHMDIARLSAAL